MVEQRRILELIGAGKTADEWVICKAALNAILGGEAIDRTGLVSATGFTVEEVDGLLDGLARRGLVVIEPASGQVVGAWGLSLVPTGHRLHIRRRELYTWCAVDAIGIPAGLDEDAVIASHCYHCGVPVNVEMVAGQVSHVEPVDVQVWVTAGQAGRSVAGFT